MNCLYAVANPRGEEIDEWLVLFKERHKFCLFILDRWRDINVDIYTSRQILYDHMTVETGYTLSALRCGTKRVRSEKVLNCPFKKILAFFMYSLLLANEL